jgi:UTP--glucose-1-phosphate uridylyltransferase
MGGKIQTAIIAAAGQGTRMWPATKVVSKELFPLGRIPVLLHVVLEVLEAGIEEVVVIATGRNLREIERLFDQSAPPPTRMVGDRLAERIERAISAAKISVVEQSRSYGNGAPLLDAADRIGTAPCLYAFGDDVVIGENATSQILDVFTSTGSPVLGVQEVDRQRISSFGIVECSTDGENEYITCLLEKPSPERTASNLASYGRYLITEPVLGCLRRVRPGRDGELWLTDAIASYLDAGGRAYVSRLRTGAWHTVGDPTGYAAAVCAATKEQQLLAGEDAVKLSNGGAPR